MQHVYDQHISMLPEQTGKASKQAKQVIVEERKGKLLYKRNKKGDYPSFCV